MKTSKKGLTDNKREKENKDQKKEKMKKWRKWNKTKKNFFFRKIYHINLVEINASWKSILISISHVGIRCVIVFPKKTIAYKWRYKHIFYSSMILFCENQTNFFTSFQNFSSCLKMLIVFININKIICVFIAFNSTHTVKDFQNILFASMFFVWFLKSLYNSSSYNYFQFTHQCMMVITRGRLLFFLLLLVML